MRTGTEATIEDLYQVEGKAELVDGEIILMSPTGYSPSRARANILYSLMNYERETGSGRALPDGVGFIVHLTRRKSFSPDVSFYTGPLPQGINMKFVEGAPAFAVEIRSENDSGLQRKRR